MSDSVQPHRRQSCELCELPRPWDSPGKNTGVGCHFCLQCVKVKSGSEVSQSCPTLSNPVDCKPTRLFCPWDFQGKSTGVGCHCLLWGSSNSLEMLSLCLRLYGFCSLRITQKVFSSSKEFFSQSKAVFLKASSQD